MFLRITFITVLFACLTIPATAEMIPYFARQYDLSCSTCHVSPPKLNNFGEDFRLNAYRLPQRQKQTTIPFAVWISGRSEHIPDSEVDQIKSFLNRVEVISGGTIGTERLSYFVEWRALSFENTGDGTLRDRSGRFEDIFVAADFGKFELTAGQFRLINQTDVSTRPGLSEPVALAGSLPGYGGGSSRMQSLRRFAPSARSPALRLSYSGAVAGSRNWTTSVAVPFPGEFSIPLTRDARTHASNEFEINPKGVVVESFIHSGVTSYGGHVFIRNSGHYLANAVAAGSYRQFYWTAIAGIENFDTQMFTRWSAEALFAPNRYAAFGTRIEERTSDGLNAALIPFVNAHFPGTRYTIRLTAEHRIQKHFNGTFVEVATIF